MQRTILVASDLTMRSREALDRAAWLAEAWNARLSVLHVADEEQLPEVIADEVRDTTAALERDLQTVGSTEMGKEVLVRTGDPFEVILAAADERDASLIVLGSHRVRRFRDIFRGTTAERVIRAGSRPVLMARGGPRTAWRHVMIALDFCDASQHALRRARALGVLNGAQVTVIHVLSPIPRIVMSYQGTHQSEIRNTTSAEVAAAADRLRALVDEIAPDLRPRFLVVEGEGPTAIQSAMAEKGADLLVVGTSGASGLRRLMVGSMAEALLATTTTDVLAVPAPLP